VALGEYCFSRSEKSHGSDGSLVSATSVADMDGCLTLHGHKQLKGEGKRKHR
jgi:hypothetical protein